MNDAQHSAYSAYLRTLADALLLRDWEIELLREWADDHTYAQAMVFHQENHLRIKVREGIGGSPPADVREWLTHEILHAHLGRLDRIKDHLVEIKDDDASKLFDKEYSDESEVVVQRLARIIAPFLPLPPDVPE